MQVPVTNEGWAKEEKQIHAKILEMAKASKGFALMAKDIKNDEDADVQTKCKLARRVFGESLDMYEDGEWTWEEFCEDFYKTCKAIGKTKPIELPQEDEAEEEDED